MTRKIPLSHFACIGTIIITAIISVSCNNLKPVEAKLLRDTTINITNAYSTEFFDSLILEDFIKTEVLSDSIANYMRNFYNSRNYSFAWFFENDLTSQAQGFWNAHNIVVKQSSDSSIFDNELHQVVDTLLSQDSSYELPKEILVLTELRFTKHFFQYVQFAYAARVEPEQVQWHIPRRKLRPLALLDSLLNSKTAEWRPMSQAYHLLQKRLSRYGKIVRTGGWPVISAADKKYKQGDSSPIIYQVKRRLQSSGDFDAGDTSIVYSNALSKAIRDSEAGFGLKQDGIIDEELIEKLNVTVEERIKQMLINLERMKWMPEVPSNYLLANIPEFRLHAIENNKEAFAMNIVVGKAANSTVIFSDQLKYVVFSPYWNMPRSIVRNEIYPAMQRSRTYLKRNNMEVTGYRGGLPVIRQKPGKDNALGGVKFIFPNNYNIYFHDTPSQGLFSRQSRAFSHGCIRLHKPFDLALHLLKDHQQWNAEKIKSAMNQSKEKWVTLQKPVTVFITYFTSWVDENGIVHFADDIYGHDSTLAKHLFD